MHSFRKNGEQWEVIFLSDLRGAEVLYKASSEVDAMSVASYLNGGAYPPLWNPPIAETKIDF